MHNWLSRLERLADEPFEDVIFDANRPGRPTNLSSEQWDGLVSILDESPEDPGKDAPHLSPQIVQILTLERFEIEYSRRHVWELLNRAGFTWKTVRMQLDEGDERAREAFRGGLIYTDSPK